MEIKLNIDFQQVVGLIRELSWADKLTIRDQLEKELKNKPEEADITLTQFLLSGPVMTKDGYENYKSLKNRFNQWSKKLSA